MPPHRPSASTDSQLVDLCVLQLYPYHLADHVCRVLRVTPFKYYIDVLFLTLKDEKSYDRIPNFTVCLCE